MLRLSDCTIAALIFSIASIPVAANASDKAPPASHGAVADLSLFLAGHITPRCELSLSDSEIKVDLTDGPGRASVDLSVDCNQNMSISMRSRNGGLLHKMHKLWDKSGGFTGFIPYDLQFSIDADGATPVRKNSREIQAAPGGGSVGAIPFRARGKLSLNWEPEGTLFGGRYGDVIEIRVSGEGEAGRP